MKIWVQAEGPCEYSLQTTGGGYRDSRNGNGCGIPWSYDLAGNGDGHGQIENLGVATVGGGHGDGWFRYIDMDDPLLAVFNPDPTDMESVIIYACLEVKAP